MDDENREDEHDCEAEHHQQFTKRLLLRLSLPTDLVGVANR